MNRIIYLMLAIAYFAPALNAKDNVADLVAGHSSRVSRLAASAKTISEGIENAMNAKNWAKVGEGASLLSNIVWTVKASSELVETPYGRSPEYAAKEPEINKNLIIIALAADEAAAAAKMANTQLGKSGVKEATELSLLKSFQQGTRDMTDAVSKFSSSSKQSVRAACVPALQKAASYLTCDNANQLLTSTTGVTVSGAFLGTCIGALGSALATIGGIGALAAPPICVYGAGVIAGMVGQACATSETNLSLALEPKIQSVCGGI